MQIEGAIEPKLPKSIKLPGIWTSNCGLTHLCWKKTYILYGAKGNKNCFSAIIHFLVVYNFKLLKVLLKRFFHGKQSRMPVNEARKCFRTISGGTCIKVACFTTRIFTVPHFIKYEWHFIMVVVCENGRLMVVFIGLQIEFCFICRGPFSISQSVC